MVTPDLILWVCAAVCFFCATIGVSNPRINILALGMFLATLTVFV